MQFVGSGFPPHRDVFVKLDGLGDPVGYPIDEHGEIRGSFSVPIDILIGEHELRFLANNPPTSTGVAVTVVASTTT